MWMYMLNTRRDPVIVAAMAYLIVLVISKTTHQICQVLIKQPLQIAFNLLYIQVQ